MTCTISTALDRHQTTDNEADGHRRTRRLIPHRSVALKPTHELTSFQRDCLYVLAGLDEPNGLTIKKKIDVHYETTVQEGRLYPNLDQLNESDLVKKGDRDKRSNYYTLTPESRRALEEHRAWQAQFLDD